MKITIRPFDKEKKGQSLFPFISFPKFSHKLIIKLQVFFLYLPIAKKEDGMK